MGETSKSLLIRLKQHLARIRKGDAETHLIRHFQLHSLENLNITGLESNPSWTSGQRKHVERVWMTKLDNVAPHCLNWITVSSPLFYFPSPSCLFFFIFIPQSMFAYLICFGSFSIASFIDIHLYMNLNKVLSFTYENGVWLTSCLFPPEPITSCFYTICTYTNTTDTFLALLPPSFLRYKLTSIPSAILLAPLLVLWGLNVGTFSLSATDTLIRYTTLIIFFLYLFYICLYCNPKLSPAINSGRLNVLVTSFALLLALMYYDISFYPSICLFFLYTHSL